MKKCLILIACVFVNKCLLAQNVGIGTTTPLRQVHIVDSTLNPNLTIESPSMALDRDVTVELKQANGAGDWLRLKKYSFLSTESIAGIPFAGSSTLFSGLDGGDLKIGALRFSAAVDVFAGGQRRVLINPNGNVGIGDVNPQALLHIKSLTGEALRVQAPAAYMSFYDNTNYTGYIQSASNTMTLASTGSNKLSLVTNFNERITALQNGNVGINNNNPLVNLHVNASTGEAIRVQAPSAYMSFYDNANYIGYLQSAGNTMSVAAQGPNKLALVTSFTERLTVGASGSIGINKTTPNTALDVNGFTRLGAEVDGAPKIKTKKIIGTTSITALPTNIPLGINSTKIISATLMIDVPNGPTVIRINYDFAIDTLANIIQISADAYGGYFYTIFITYEE